MNRDSPDRHSRALLAAPLVFAAHVLEESPRFGPWFNAHVARGIQAAQGGWLGHLGAYTRRSVDKDRGVVHASVPEAAS